MPREIITIGAGQCGNQISKSFWERLCAEHGIQGDGTLQAEATAGMDRKDVFFNQSDDMRYIPRAVLLDLEPKVIRSVQNSVYGDMYNPENIFVSKSGSGAGNNWGAGYLQGQHEMEQILDILDREADYADNLDAFMLMHSVAGGTGSGLGSTLLENIKEHFPKTVIQTVSVLPSSASDIVVEPYNSVLTLRRLIENADSVLMFDNNALLRIAGDTANAHQRHESPSMDQVNALVSTALLTATSTVRFPGYLYNSWTSILTSVIPTPAHHFLTCSYTPFLSADDIGGRRYVRKTTVTEIMHRLLQQKYSMLAISPQAFKNAKYLSALRIVQGDLDVSEYRQRLLSLNDSETIVFSPGYTELLQFAVAKRSPFVNYQTRLNGLGLVNSTGVADCFERTMLQFNKLYTRHAFLNEYKKLPLFENNLDEFDEAKYAIENLVDDYKRM